MCVVLDSPFFPNTVYLKHNGMKKASWLNSVVSGTESLLILRQKEFEKTFFVLLR